MELLTEEQVQDWREFYATEPWGFEAHNILVAHLAAMVSAFLGNKDPRREKYMLKPAVEDDDDEPTPEEFIAALKAVMAPGRHQDAVVAEGPPPESGPRPEAG
jgi:hypothetical protein